ncbi:hypothetical protein GALMADRAFT_1345025 [Galerina marginata CBS 339.88]|uniref:Uncharacterized protein n=1 Tax=Galerina marginata (strain CBS 339.88) TaxID=685588 RepID=A0A067SM28_GALM3|nr:hypothetical protein GALMADRAFT_1345025 [Galerina marginata CBS 339.88]
MYIIPELDLEIVWIRVDWINLNYDLEGSRINQSRYGYGPFRYDDSDSDDSDDKKDTATTKAALKFNKGGGTKAFAIPGNLASPQDDDYDDDEEEEDGDLRGDDRIKMVIRSNPLDNYHPSVFHGLNDGIHRNFDFTTFGYQVLAPIAASFCHFK